MSWRKIFTPEKGNQMKRWTRFHLTMSKKRWFELDREKNGPITLFDFSTVEDAVDAALGNINSRERNIWRTTDDSLIGGYSKARTQMVRTNENDNDDNDKDDFVPFVRWKGTLDTRVSKDSKKNKVRRSGFCTILSPEFPMGGVDLGGRYNGLEIMCRSDGRPYSFNLKVESFIHDDLFQCFINIPATTTTTTTTKGEGGGKFDKVVLLFQHFIVTAGGRLRARQRYLDNSIKIQSMGVTLMDGTDGDFEFDLSRIRAVNYDETGVIGKAD
ncbi:CIA30-domain-containing protein [Fragilariopsis cylindrus CCMP1102]|uniref:CIA30-domain-containing protein n=1 Tax=Fragilariopsis cylindrus CCMP1102 TaxID=635003 RepID=A0A1E7F5U4_9STRA|nr:CIA30-domain-containing protein [Fragilariopsis cylindrus CCMP1102]|eukprot:OEU13233.1 CIA30-domain-containing protein [Fragilariopsis cylindrus CCMP1102]